MAGATVRDIADCPSSYAALSGDVWPCAAEASLTAGLVERLQCATVAGLRRLDFDGRALLVGGFAISAT
jgi:hypothetical protein